MNETENKLIDAKKLSDNKNYTEAIKLFISVENLNAKQKEFQLLCLSHCYFSIYDFQKSLYYANLLSNINESSEFASQLKYLSLVKLERIDEALVEITNFLNKYPANLYKITLSELIKDVERKTIDSRFANKILHLLNKNNVHI